MTDNGLTIAPWAGRRRADALALTRRKGAHNNTPCKLCEQPIDYNLRYPHPYSCSVQHVLSRHTHPHLTWNPTNWAPAHLVCNQAAGDGTDTDKTNLGLTTPLWTT